MNILILGGSGYLGSKVSREFIAAGDSVVCTKRDSSRLFRVQDISRKIRWIPATVNAVESVLQTTSFDYVINMVCNYGRSNVLYDDVLEANIIFPLKVLNKIVEYGGKRFMTIGTGLPDDLNMYSFSKKMFSEFGKFYVKEHGVVFNALLLELFYGYDEPIDRFLPSMIRKMIDGDSVEITEGCQRRDIICVNDVLKAISMVINSPMTGFNEIPVGTGIAPTISEIVDYIWETTGKRSIVHKGAVPMRQNEPDCKADIRILQQLGQWNPVFWKDGLLEMIKQMGKRG